MSAFRPSAALFAATLVFAGAASASDNEVLRWNLVATDAAVAAKIDPLTESRIFAIVQIAVHDALNAIEPRFEAYPTAASLRADSSASADAAVVAAAHEVLSQLIPAEAAAFGAARAKALAAIPDGAAETRGLEVGRRSAGTILKARRGDGSDAPTPYQPGTAPGAYRPTPPDFTPAFQTHWGSVTPFALESGTQFRPEPPPVPGTPRALWEIHELELVGPEKGSVRTDEQSQIARYWYESSPQGWNRIARAVAAERGLDLWESARLLGLVNIAMADGFIAGFEAKYHYNYWRPATAIRANGSPEWLPYLGTPPVPDYPSTHTVLGAAAAAVLARYFDTDFLPFAMTSGEPYPGITRKFWSFSEAARENGASRILAGIHFSTAVEAGFRQGDEVGAWAFDHVLRPRAQVTASAR